VPPAPGSSPRPPIRLLRPLTGATDDIVAIHQGRLSAFPPAHRGRPLRRRRRPPPLAGGAPHPARSSHPVPLPRPHQPRSRRRRPEDPARCAGRRRRRARLPLAADRTDDELPTPPVESAEATLADPDRRRLRELGRLAKTLLGSGDTKLDRCAELVGALLAEGFYPIVWCRYIATADYVAAGLQKALRRTVPDLRVISITGRIGDDERRTRVAELAAHKPRALVATDCLSEGIYLQDAFSATLHYDLPWNPNRLEQRDGRVDRYGQEKPTVRSIRYFNPDSAVAGVVLDVLLNKARRIHRALGTHVPVSDESESLTEAVLNALFLLRRRDTGSAQ